MGKDARWRSRPKVTCLASKVHRRLSGRWRRDPVAPMDSHNLARKTTPAGTLLPLPESQWYRGYSDQDLSLFNHSTPVKSDPQPGFIVDFLGVLIRISHMKSIAGLDGQLLGLSVPVDDGFHAETIEDVGLLKSVLTAQERYVALELGAVWGPWLVSGGRQPGAGASRTSDFTGSKVIPNISPPW